MSKELFFNMRAEDLAFMYSETFSKKDAELTGQELVKNILNDGLIDPIKVYSNIVRLKAVIDSADKSFRDHLEIPSKYTFNGVEFNPSAGRENLNYEEDPVCAELSGKLKERQELVKLATKSKDTIFDTDGCEVPKVSSTFTKSSITIKF